MAVSEPIPTGIWSWLRYPNRIESIIVWLISYPSLPLQVALFCLVAWGGLGEAVGLNTLLWHDRFDVQFFGGAAIGVLFGEVLLLRYLLHRDRSREWKRWTLSLFHSDDPQIRNLGRYMSLAWLGSLAILYLPKCISPAFREHPGRFVALPAGFLAAIGIVVALAWLTEKLAIRDGIQRLLNRTHLPGFPNDPAERSAEMPLHAAATIVMAFALLFLIAFLIAREQGHILPPVMSTCVLLVVINGIAGFLQFHFRGIKYLLIVTLIIALLLINRSPYRMTIPGLEDRYRDDPKNGYLELDVQSGDAQQPAAKDKYQKALDQSQPSLDWSKISQGQPPEGPSRLIDSRVPLRAISSRWKTGPEDKSKPRLVLIATSGGGIRAAVWTAVVLEGLLAEIPGEGPGQKPGLLDHVRMISGASGGMVAAAMFVGDYPNIHQPGWNMSDRLAKDSLTPAMDAMLFHDLPALFRWGQLKTDRGRVLEQAWYDNTRDSSGRSPLEMTFENIHDDEKGGLRPSLVFSPMLAEDARRLLISNLDLNELTEAKCARLRPDDLNEDPWMLSLSALELRRLFPEALKMKLGTVARLNATFPFVTPGVSLPTKPPRRVIDAGYFDNFGVDVACMWLLQHHDEIVATTSGVVLIEIRAYRNGFMRRHIQDAKEEIEQPDGPGGANRYFTPGLSMKRREQASLFDGLAEVSTPFQGLVQNWSRGTLYRDDEFLEFAGRLFNGNARIGDTKPPFLTTVAFECDTDAALSWNQPPDVTEKVRQAFFRSDPPDPNNPNSFRRLHPPPTGPQYLNPRVYEQVRQLAQWFGTGGSERPSNLPVEQRAKARAKK
jgi:Patatin-like phospholipase